MSTEQAAQAAQPDSASTGFTPDPEARRLLYDELRHRHDVQRTVSERLEGKAALVLGADLALFQFVAREPVNSWWLPVALVLYASSALSALRVVLPRRFQELDPAEVVWEVWWWPLSDAAGRLTNARLSAVKANVTHQAFKVRWLRVSIWLLLLGAMMSAVHVTQGERDEREREQSAGSAITGAAPETRAYAGAGPRASTGRADTSPSRA